LLGTALKKWQDYKLVLIMHNQMRDRRDRDRKSTGFISVFVVVILPYTIEVVYSMCARNNTM